MVVITLEEAKQLKPGDILIDNFNKRWKVNGKVKTWVSDTNRIRVPLKHGLYVYGALVTEDFVIVGTVSKNQRQCDWMTKED